jgi:hypothetical protein
MMFLIRPMLAAATLCAASTAEAQTMTAAEAKEFVSGALFSYRCFDGTVGGGRIFGDGSASGSIRVMGRGPNRYLQLPPNTLYLVGAQVCARLKGLPFEPCFDLTKTGPESFRGSLSHMNFMYCDFRRGGSVLQLARRRGASEPKVEPAKAEAPKTEQKPTEAKAEEKPAEAKAVGGDMQLRH